MAYPYFTAGQAINVSPKQDYTELFQETVRDQFYNASDWYTIQEETVLASDAYQNVDVRVNALINTNTGEKVEDDYKSISFMDINHDVSLGKMYQFDSNYWVTVNIDKIKTLASTAIIKRCNNFLRWMDENTGAIYQVPCSLASLIKLNKDYSTTGSAIVAPAGTLQCDVQFNSKSNKIKPNQRFLFGNQHNWTAYRVEGGGINNFNNLFTADNMSSGLTKLTLVVDYVNATTDDLVNGIANISDNIYVLTLNQSSISGSVSQTVQLVPTLTLNGNTTTRSLVWTSSDITKATVDSSGLVTFIATGTSTISCSVVDNSDISATCSATTVSSPVDNYQVIISPDVNYILEGLEKTWLVYLYKNGTQQSDTFTFSLDSNTVTSANYSYAVINGNSFKIKNIKKFLTDTLDVTCSSGIYSKIISVSLRGAW